MKKVVAVLAVVLSTGALAQTMNYSANTGNLGHSNMNHGGMMNQISSLTPEQQSEYNLFKNKYRVEMQNIMLDLEDINLKIEREMISTNPNQNNIDKLIDQKVAIQGKREKSRLNFKIEAKEKFGIDMRNGGRNCRMMGSKKMMNSNKMSMNKSMGTHSNH